jgi:hypothetical protein
MQRPGATAPGVSVRASLPRTEMDSAKASLPYAEEIPGCASLVTLGFNDCGHCGSEANGNRIGFCDREYGLIGISVPAV